MIGSMLRSQVGSAVRAGLHNSTGLTNSVQFTLNTKTTPLITESMRFATKKAGGTVNNTSDSAGRRLGIKRYANELVRNGHIIVRQRGRQYIPGLNVHMSKDFTLHSLINGKVVYTHMTLPGKSKRSSRCFVNVLPREEITNNLLIEWTANYMKKYIDSQLHRNYQKANSHRKTTTPLPPRTFPPQLSY